MNKKSKFLVFLAIAFIGIPTIFAVESTMSSDVSSYPGAGTVPPGTIGSYINTGYRVYIVDRKTGGLLQGSKVVDMASDRLNASTIKFYKTSSKYRKIAFNNQAFAQQGNYTTFISKNELKEYPKDDTVYLTMYEGVPFPSNWDSNSANIDPVNVFNNKLNNQGATNDKVSDFYDFIFDYIYKVCGATDYDCRLKKKQEIGAYELKNKNLPDTETNRVSNYYIIWEPLIFYKIFDKGYYALTATESALIFNETNFPKWWNGVTVRPEPKYHEFAPDHFDNVLNYSSCTTELNQALDDLLLGKDGASDELKAWNSRCEKTLRWIFSNPISARFPRFTTHTKSYTIGKVTYSPYIPDGTEFNRYPSSFKLLDIIGNKKGIGMGVVEMLYVDPSCPATMDTARNLKTNGCCTKFSKYLEEIDLYPELKSKESEAKLLYETECNKCSMQNPTLIERTISSMPANKCCYVDEVNKWFADDNNNKNPKYEEYKTTRDTLCPQDDGDGNDPNVCVYKIETKYPASCSTDTTGYVSDIDNWDCIFKSPTQGGTNFSNNYDEFSNRYCNIFCRQDVKYDFPSSSFTVLAGNHFTVGITQTKTSNWNPISMTETSTCKVDSNGINQTKFVDDWRTSNIAVQTAWNKLQIEVAKEKSIANARYQANDSSCSCMNTTPNGVDCCTREEAYCPSGTLENGRCVTTSGTPQNDYINCTGTINPTTRKCSACPAGYSVNGVNCKSDATICKNGEKVGSTCVSYGSVSYRCAAGATNNTKYGKYYPVSSRYPISGGTDYIQPAYCANESRPSTNVAGTRIDYNRAVNTRDGYLATLNQCVNYSYNHTFMPQLSVTYEEAKYGGKFSLIGNATDSKSTILEPANSVPGKIMSYSCTTDGNTCTTLDVSYPTAKNITHTSTRVVSYTLDGTVYRYIDKLSGNSANSYASFNEYINIGYNNLPVDFTRYSGQYDIQINFSNFGVGNKFNEYIVNGKADTKTCDGSPNCVYTCNYAVENRVLCDPKTEVCDSSSGNNGGGGLKGLNILFRPITSSNPFPGIDGNGREAGSNWQGSETKITKNRGVNAEELYSKREPMYEIKLDSKTIRAIREDNKKTSYTDFNLTCKTGTGKECISEFLTTLNKTSGLKINKCARDVSNNWANTCSFE